MAPVKVRVPRTLPPGQWFDSFSWVVRNAAGEIVQRLLEKK